MSTLTLSSENRVLAGWAGVVLLFSLLALQGDPKLASLVALAAFAGFLSLLINWGVVTDWFDFGAFLIRWWLAGLLGVFLVKLPLSFLPTLDGR